MPFDPLDARRWLNDMLHHIAMAEGFVAGVTYESYKDDNLRLYAVTRCLKIISEASRRMPPALKARHASIEWREMASAGNSYRHEYEDVSALRVWTTLSHHLSLLREVIVQELATLDGQVPC